jgi:D-alanine-D-alanine ligase
MEKPFSVSKPEQLPVWGDTSLIKILYLAKYAPLDGAPTLREAPDATLGMARIYHQEIFDILESIGFKLIPAQRVESLLVKPAVDYVFSLYNRNPFNGSAMLVASLCEFFDIPYLGAPSYARALADDKHLAKLLARHLRIPTPDWILVRQDQELPLSPKFNGPFFTKPRFGAGSEGIDESSIQDLWADAAKQASKLCEMGYEVLIERFVEGTNATVPVIGGRKPYVLPAIQNSSSLKGEVLTSEQKNLLQEGLQRAVLESGRRAEIEQFSLTLFDNLGPTDYARIDFRLPNDPSEQAMFLEVNMCPNLGSHSTVVLSAQAAGLTQKDVIARILCYSFQRQGLKAR